MLIYCESDVILWCYCGVIVAVRHTHAVHGHIPVPHEEVGDLGAVLRHGLVLLLHQALRVEHALPNHEVIKKTMG